MENKRELSKVSMMSSPKTVHYFMQNVHDIYDVVKLEYKNSKLSLVLVIDKKGGHNAKPLSSTDIWSIHWQHSKLNLFLPKFKFKYESNLNTILQSMGIVDAFNDPKANFVKMNASNELLIGLVIHKAMVEVDETGTEAAAVTVVAMKSKKSARKPKQEQIIPTIRFDHPFDFFIVDELKKSTLFSGRYVGK